METIKEAWSGILQYLHEQDDISEVAFNVWITCIEPRTIEDGKVVVFVHTNFQRKIITEHYSLKLRDAFQQVLGIPLGLMILSGEDSDTPLRSPRRRRPGSGQSVRQKSSDYDTPLKISWWARPTNSPTRPPRQWPANPRVIIILYLYTGIRAWARPICFTPSATKSGKTIRM